MLRTLFSVVAVLVLVFVAFLVYRSLSQRDKSEAQEALESLRPALPHLGHTPPPAPEAPKIKIDTTPPTATPNKDAVISDPAKTAVAAPPPVPEAPRGKRTHVVRSGESLWSISKDYFGSAEHTNKIAEANHLREKDRIRIGQVLIIPALPNVKILETGSEDHESGPESLSTVVSTPVSSTKTASQPEARNTDAAETLEPDNDPMPPTLDARRRKE
jgi:LysM repeat protein